MNISDIDLRIIDTLSEGNYTIKELYLNFVGIEVDANNFFASLRVLNRNGFLKVCDDLHGDLLSEEAVDDWIGSCLRAAETDWKTMPNYEINPSQGGFSFLKEKGFGHP